MNPSDIYILIICEESQTVCKAFRKRGFKAFSCDLQECSGGHPEWHYQEDCFKVVKLRKWDLIIAHPPCTYLSNSGVTWLYEKENRKTINLDRWEKMILGISFFNQILKLKVDRLAVENPIQHIFARERINEKYKQIIQPWWFGHPESKATCLWLKNLPLLHGTKKVDREMMKLPEKERQKNHWLWGHPKERSVTYLGIAEAMADQWGRILLENKKIIYNVPIKPIF